MSEMAMQGSPEPPPARDASPSARGYETSDASGFYVSMFALALAVAIAMVLLLLVWLFGRFEASAERGDPLQSALADDQVPPAPRLETSSGAALSEFVTREDKDLATYGWIDRRQGVVRLPIDRAIELLAERGLPEPEGPAEPESKKEPMP
jgi:hypothetical protein